MIAQLLIQYAQADWESGDNSAVVAALNSESIEVRDDSLYTWAGIALLAGPQAAEALRLALEANGMGWAVHQFGGTGLQLTNPLVRSAIQQFITAGVPLQPVLDATISYVSPAMQVLGREVTAEEVAAYRVALERQNAINAYRIRFDAIINQIGTSEQPAAVADLQAIVAELIDAR